VDAERLPVRHISTKKLRSLRLKRGDLVLEKSGGGEEAPVGIAVMFDQELVAVPSNFAARVRPADGVDPGFLRYVFASLYYMRINERSIKQTTGIQNLDVWSYLDEPCIAPIAINEQRRIAKFLDRETERIDSITARKRRLLDLLAERRRALIASEMNGDNADDLLPLRRCVRKFVDYRGATPVKTPTGVPLVTARNIRDGRIDLVRAEEFIADVDYRVWMRRGMPDQGDVLITTEAPLGAVAQIVDTHVALAQRVILLKPNTARVSADYLARYLQSPAAQAELEMRATGSTALGIRADRLRAVPVRVPPSQDQAAMVRRVREGLNRIDELRGRLVRQQDLLAEYRRALITETSAGRLNVPAAA
jgi:type I restriction enzyme S subunit